MSVKIHGKEYRTVAERMHLLGGDIGRENYSLMTEIIQFDDDLVVMKAVLTIDYESNNKQTYVGHAFEKFDSSQINKTSALENCETSAIGRALAAVGLAGTEYASADEVANAINQQQSSDGNNGDKYYSMTGEMTGKQTALIEKLCNSHVITTDEKDDTDEWMKNDRTKGEASKMIDRLKEMIDDREAVENSEKER